MKNENKAIAITAIISVAVLVIVVAALLILKAGTGYTRNTVTVDGISEVKATPDLVSVYLTIETKGNTSAVANDKNTEIYDKLVFELAKAGFGKDRLKTESYSVYPNYVWDGETQKQEGHVAMHYLKVKLSEDEMDKVSSVVDAGINAGAGISYINFELTQESQNSYKAEALTLASEDAKIKADAVAEGLGKSAGRLVSVQVSDFGYYPWNLYTAKSAGGATAEDAALARESATSINPSEQSISARVSATFKLI